eukprot:7982357-Alexandrium_andersonii.AAC.1
MLHTPDPADDGLGSPASGVTLRDTQDYAEHFDRREFRRRMRIEDAMQDVADREAQDWARELQERQEAMAVASHLEDEA